MALIDPGSRNTIGHVPNESISNAMGPTNDSLVMTQGSGVINRQLFIC